MGSAWVLALLGWGAWGALRWRRPTLARSNRGLFVPAAVYGAVAAVGLALRVAGVRTPLYFHHNDDRGFFTFIALVVHGAVALPLGYLAASVDLAGARRAVALALAAVSALALLPTAWSLYVEPQTLVERAYHLRSPRAPPGGLTILHVSDLQTDGDCRRERLVREATRRRTADLVVFSGDLTNGIDVPSEPVAARMASAHAFLAALRGTHGVFAVMGDWDGWGDDWPRQEREIFTGTGARMLRDETVRFTAGGGPVTLFGSLGEGPTRERLWPDLRGEEGFRIVAVHHPDRVVEQAVEGSWDLVLAGHTHGGQVVLPLLGARVTHNAHGFVGGRYTVNGTPLLVSRGIGMRGGMAPRVRFRCPPELTWITVTR
ncbi:MAG: metallophosphoesterase [Deltaproteobacteria bacterium]|nr:metallophosphoesterase [Deltaproteobacteria bacterium]